MHKSNLIIAILSVLMLIGCGDDDSGGKLGPPAGNSCADVAGTWSMELEIESDWFGGVLSTMAELAQSGTCTVTGTMVGGQLIEGYSTQDSLYFDYGMAGSGPEDQVRCALAIVDEYLMEGQYDSADGSGAMRLHGPDPDCSGTVEMQVSAGLSPTFSWQPACSASLMLIEPLESGADQWNVGNDNANDLNSGMTYGVAPPGVISRVVVPLVEGLAYRVALYRWLEVEDAYLMVGYALFTP
jgi:hypothetical protein